jgi:hypothetical protein
MEVENTGLRPTPELLQKLAEFHADPIICGKKGDANYGKYITYEEILKRVREPMSKHGLFFQHVSHSRPGGAAIETIIFGHGGALSSGIVDVPASKQNEHGYGGAVTYGKRYSLVLALGIGGDKDLVEDYRFDDDGKLIEAEAQQAPPPPPPARKPKAQKTPENVKQEAEGKNITVNGKEYGPITTCNEINNLVDEVAIEQWKADNITALKLIGQNHPDLAGIISGALSARKKAISEDVPF